MIDEKSNKRWIQVLNIDSSLVNAVDGKWCTVLPRNHGLSRSQIVYRVHDILKKHNLRAAFIAKDDPSCTVH